MYLMSLIILKSILKYYELIKIEKMPIYINGFGLDEWQMGFPGFVFQLN